MEWITGVVEGEEGMEVDIGYMPLMEWTMDRESRLPLTEEEAKSGTAEHPPLQSPDQIEWSSEVPREDLLRLIEIEFYPFKKVMSLCFIDGEMNVAVDAHIFSVIFLKSFFGV